MVPVLGLVVASAIAGARPVNPLAEWFAHSEDTAWLQAYDPTLISERVHSELNYQDLGDDRSVLRLETSLRWPVPIRDDLAVGFQVMVPLEWDDDGSSDEWGVSDLEFRTGLVGRISPTLRYGFGLNAAFDTASDSSLGGSALVLRPTAAIRWDAGDRVNLGLTVEYSFTPKDEGPDDVSVLQVKVPVAIKINDCWSGALTFKPRWNFLTNDDRHRIELGATRVWGPRHQYAFSFGTELPLSSQDLDWKLITSFSWYF